MRVLTPFENAVRTALIEIGIDESVSVECLPEDLQTRVELGELTLEQAGAIFDERLRDAISSQAFEGAQRRYLKTRPAAATPPEDYAAGWREGWRRSSQVAELTIVELTKDIEQLQAELRAAREDRDPKPADSQSTRLADE